MIRPDVREDVRLFFASASVFFVGLAFVCSKRDFRACGMGDFFLPLNCREGHIRRVCSLHATYRERWNLHLKIKNDKVGCPTFFAPASVFFVGLAFVCSKRDFRACEMGDFLLPLNCREGHIRRVCSLKEDKEGRFELRIDGVSHHSWFRCKKDEFMEALGLPTSRRQNRGLKL